MNVEVRNTRSEDFAEVIALSHRVYPESSPWKEAQLASHVRVFPEGQFVALRDGHVAGMAASLVVAWDDYEMGTAWRDFTDNGMFTNHDAQHGHTLYAAEVMVEPAAQGGGVGSLLYAARRELVETRGLLRIRAGARMRGYHTYAERLAPDEYLEQVARGKLYDPTLTFQLRRGFRVLGLILNYLRHDPESLGHAACIEWLNERVAVTAERNVGDPRYRVPFVAPQRPAAAELA